MGRRKTIVSGVVEKMNDEKYFKYSHQEALSAWIWESSKHPIMKGPMLGDYYLDYANMALSKKYERLYNWASKPNRVPYGLPQSTLLSEPDKLYIEATKKYLETQTNKPIEIASGMVSERDFYYSLWLILVKDYGYTTDFNELTKLSKEKGTTVYLKDAVLHLTQRTLDEYSEIGITNDSLSFSFGLTNDRTTDISRTQSEHIISTDKDKAVLEYQYVVERMPEPSMDNLDVVLPTEEVITETIEIDLSHINPEEIEGEDVLPEHEYIYLTYKQDGVYYWFEYVIDSGDIPEIDNLLKGNKVLGEFFPRLYTRIDNKDVIENPDKDIVKASKRLFKRVNLDLKVVTEQFHKSIKDEYSHVRNMFIFQGVNVNDSVNDPALAEYCFRYFHRLYEVNGGKAGLNEVKDKVASQKFQYDWIKVEEILGVYQDLKPKKFKAIRDEVTVKKRRGGLNGLIGRKRRVTTYGMSFYHQVDETKYIKVSVWNLQNYTWANGHGFNKTLADKDLVLPLDRTLTKHLKRKEKEKLFYKGMAISILHVKVVKKKWYETTLFKVVMVVIVAVVTFVAPPAGAGLGATMGAMLKAGAIALLKGLALNYALNLALELLVEAGLISPKLAVILQAVISIASMAYGGGVWDFSNLLTAPNLMNTINTAFNAYQKLETMKLQDAMKQYNQLVEERNKSVAEAQKLLETKVFEPSMELLTSNYTPSVGLFDTVEMFYARHAGFNVVDISHDLITNYVEGSKERSRLYLNQTISVEEVLLIK